MVADDKVIHFGPQANINSALSQSAQQAIKSCRETILTGLPKSFAFFDTLDDTLFDLADKAESNQKQEEYFTAMRQIRLVQADIKKQFTQKIVNDFDTFWKKPSSKSYPRLETNNETNNETNLEIDEDELSLLQNADLEEDIAIKRISSKSKSICGNEVGKLTTRFAHMLKMENEAKLDNPFEADNVIKHLKEVISPLPVSIPIKLVIYKQYEIQAVNSLLKLYQAINKQLIENGILPKISYKTTQRAKTAADRQTNTVSHNADNINLPLEQAVEQHMQNRNAQLEHESSDLFDSLRQLLTRSNNPVMAPSTAPTDLFQAPLTTTVDHQTLLSALSNLQHDQVESAATNEQGQFELPELRSTLLQTLNTAQSASGISQTISPLDSDTLDIVDLLFEFILEDKNIPLPMRGLLARLQIPMLKIAIADKSFFHHKNHPARRLLNNLAKAATGWTQPKHYEQDPLYQHIDDIVTTLINDFEYDIQIFDQIDETLAEFVKQYDRNSQAIEKLTAETSEGQERVQLAQQHVDSVIHDLYIEASPVPKVIVSLIEDGWKQSLRLRLIQKGEDSQEWQTSLNLIKQLLASVKLKESEEERQQLLELVPGLHKEIQQYLQTTPITPNTLAVLMKALQRCHVKILNGDPILENELKYFSAETAPEPSKIDDPQKRVELQMYSNATALEKVKKLKIGTWVDIQEPDKAPRRIKFSWRSNLTKRCLFVTSKGVKAAEWSEQELAAMFEKGEASILDQSKPLMDRALISMMETVNKSH